MPHWSDVRRSIALGELLWPSQPRLRRKSEMRDTKLFSVGLCNDESFWKN